MEINTRSYSDPASPPPPPPFHRNSSELQKSVQELECLSHPVPTGRSSFRACAYTTPLWIPMHPESSRSVLGVVSFGTLNKARTDETDGPCRCRAWCLFNIVARSDVRQMRCTAKASNAYSASCKGCGIKCQYRRLLESQHLLYSTRHRL